MTEIGIVIGFLITGGAGLVIGYLVGSRHAGAQAAPQQTAAAPAQHEPEPPRPRQRVEAYSVDARPAAGGRPAAGARPAPAAPRAPAAAPIFVADKRPDDDRTVIRKLKSAREAFQESKNHLEQVKEHPPGDDSARFGGRKKE